MSCIMCSFVSSMYLLVHTHKIHAVHVQWCPIFHTLDPRNSSQCCETPEGRLPGSIRAYFPGRCFCIHACASKAEDPQTDLSHEERRGVIASISSMSLTLRDVVRSSRQR